MIENPSPHWSLRTRSWSFDYNIIKNNIKRGYKLNQRVRSPIEMVFPVTLDFISKTLRPECRFLRVKAIQYLFKHVFESPEEDKWGVNADIPRYQGKVIGDSPELGGGTDCHGFAHFKESVALHIAITYSLPIVTSRKIWLRHSERGLVYYDDEMLGGCTY